MIKLLKIGNAIYENYELITLKPTEFDENGNPTKFEEVYTIDLQNLREYIKDTVLWYAKILIERTLNQKHYHSLGDVLIYKENNDEEAVKLYNWYLNFENLVWNWLENEFPNISDDELLNIDIKNMLLQFQTQAEGGEQQ